MVVSTAWRHRFGRGAAGFKLAPAWVVSRCRSPARVFLSSSPVRLLASHACHAKSSLVATALATALQQRWKALGIGKHWEDRRHFAGAVDCGPVPPMSMLFCCSASTSTDIF